MVGEILDGDLVVTPRPAPTHAHASSAIGADLFGPFGRRAGGGDGGPGGWWILDEPELHLHGDALVPELAGWGRERLPSLPPTPAFELPPDWVCEVLSPSTARLDRARKTEIYARERIGHMWLVDPVARTLEVFRLEGDGWKLVRVHADEPEPVRVEPFEAILVDIASWWADEARS
jgi:Uma2 family endonuclease